MMKTQIRAGLVFSACLVASLTATESYSQALTNAEVPGDHFSLEGALELFKKSSSPEEFERMLNVPDSKVNNLDLNGDGLTDYIRVNDRYDGNIHAFILQAVVSPNEAQDIAVIELELLGDGKASLQIVGDPDIYGVETIIEPTQEVRTYAGTQTSRATINVWTWPVVQYCYNPYYSVWISPWSWYARPIWWNPWRPVAYVVYRPYWTPYRNYYSYCNYHRNVYAHNVYIPVRTTSVIVNDRHRDAIMYSRNTRGREYNQDGRYRDSDRSQRQSGSRDNYTGRTNQSGRQRDDKNYDTDRSNGRVRTSNSYVRPSESSRTERVFSAPRQNNEQAGTEPTFTSPRQSHDNGNSNRTRTHVSETRTSSPDRTVHVAPSPRPAQSEHRSSSESVSQRPQQHQSAPQVHTRPSGGSSGSSGGSPSHGVGGHKRGRE
jgi:hypothetical protein